jgi:hypothetical protein
MEILILGLILVALMVWASTKIKKNAAQAYEREVIDNADFSLVKPDGFLHVLNGDAKFAFEAYSKEFGKDETHGLRQARATIRHLENTTVKKVSGGAREGLTEPETEGSYVSGLRSEKDAVFEVFHKIIAKNGGVFDLEVSVLHDYADEQTANVHELLESFRVK